MKITTRKYILYTVAAVCGVVIWISISLHFGISEAWDTSAYFSIGIPALCIVSGALAIIEPKHVWRWAFLPFLAQAVYLILKKGFGNMMPLGILVFAFLSLPSLITARIGAFIRKKPDNKNIPLTTNGTPHQERNVKD